MSLLLHAIILFLLRFALITPECSLKALLWTGHSLVEHIHDSLILGN